MGTGWRERPEAMVLLWIWYNLAPSWGRLYS